MLLRSEGRQKRIPPYNYGFSVILRAVCHSERQRRILVVVLGDPSFLRMTDTPLVGRTKYQRIPPYN